MRRRRAFVAAVIVAHDERHADDRASERFAIDAIQHVIDRRLHAY
jgi:hypothetical protein